MPDIALGPWDLALNTTKSLSSWILTILHSGAGDGNRQTDRRSGRGKCNEERKAVKGRGRVGRPGPGSFQEMRLGDGWRLPGGSEARRPVQILDPSLTRFRTTGTLLHCSATHVPRVTVSMEWVSGCKVFKDPIGHTVFFKYYHFLGW